MKKKIFAILMLASMVLSILSGCSNSKSTPSAPDGSTPSTSAETSSAPSAADDYPNKNLTILVNGNAGGAPDSNVRLLQPYLEEVMGTTVVVENVPGSGGWIAWNQMMQADPDGYTIAMGNAHTIFTYFDPSTNNSKNLDDFNFLCNLVRDAGVIGIRPDDPLFEGVEDLNDFVEVVKNYDGEILMGVGAANGDDHMLALKICKEAGLDNVTILPAASGTSELKSTFYGGHCDVYVGNVGDTYQNYLDGEIKLLCVAADERSESLPEIPTTKELGFSFTQCADRNFVAQPGMDEAVKEKLVNYLKEAIMNPEYIEKMAETGNEVYFMDGDELTESMYTAEEQVKGILDLMGWA